MPIGMPFTAGGLPTSGGGVSPDTTLGTILNTGLSVFNALLAERGGTVAGFTSSAPQDVTTGVQAVVPAGACGCVQSSQVRKCGPAWIPRSDWLGTPACDDPCYPRLYFHKNADGDPEARCGRARRKPRMNPMNPRAAGRAARRLAGAARAFKRIKKATSKAARMY